jgi:hypothetical protein
MTYDIRQHANMTYPSSAAAVNIPTICVCLSPMPSDATRSPSGSHTSSDPSAVQVRRCRAVLEWARAQGCPTQPLPSQRTVSYRDLLSQQGDGLPAAAGGGRRHSSTGSRPGKKSATQQARRRRRR